VYVYEPDPTLVIVDFNTPWDTADAGIWDDFHAIKDADGTSIVPDFYSTNEDEHGQTLTLSFPFAVRLGGGWLATAEPENVHFTPPLTVPESGTTIVWPF
jgi:hypothetical protein